MPDAQYAQYVPDNERIDVTDWDFVQVRTRGASAKSWLREPGGSSSRPENDWLFKPVTVHGDGSIQVGDWAETVASSVARSLAIPSAEAVQAVRDRSNGVILRNVRPAGYDMVTGRMAMIDEIEVETRDSRRDHTASIGHSLENVQRTLGRYGPPPEAPLWTGCDAFDVMTSYLFLDALIGNGDRHEQNWSVLRATSSADSSSDVLAPSYDMEASLGFQLTDAARSARLGDEVSLAAFARKGVARRFDGDRTTTLVEFAVRALGLCSSQGQRRIEQLVQKMGELDFVQVVEDHPTCRWLPVNSR